MSFTGEPWAPLPFVFLSRQFPNWDDGSDRANGVAGLKQMVKTVEKRSKLVSDVLQDAAKALENEERADQEAREQFGDRFDRTPSASASASLKCV